MLKPQHQQCLSTLGTHPELLISLRAAVATKTTTESTGREPLRRFPVFPSRGPPLQTGVLLRHPYTPADLG